MSRALNESERIQAAVIGGLEDYLEGHGRIDVLTVAIGITQVLVDLMAWAPSEAAQEAISEAIYDTLDETPPARGAHVHAPPERLQ